MARGRAAAWLAALAVAAPLALVSAPAQAATAAKPYDFDGDGYPELVVGVPDLTVGGHEEAGGVTWQMSRNSRVTTDESVLTQSSAKVAGASEDGDQFGAAVASADFDRDGYADVAVGAPGEDGSKAKQSGSVTVLYGSPDGPTGTGSARFSQPKEERDAHFGAALATGDVNGDGFADLVVGAPGDDNADPTSHGFPASGTVTVLLGSKDGITTKGRRVLQGVRGTDHDYAFGSALRVADVDADGRADIVVLASGAQNRDGAAYDGSVSFCSGGTAGPAGCQRLGRDATGGRYASVAVGDVSGPGVGRPEIVVGVVAGEESRDHLDVYSLTGSGAATRATVAQLDQAQVGVPGSRPDGRFDDFGASVAISELTGDTYADVVVGAPREAVGDEEAGRVILIRGGVNGLARSGNRAFDQETPGVPGGSEEGDDFGAALTIVDRDLDGRADVVVGVPGKNDDLGRVVFLGATGTGLGGADRNSDQLSGFGYAERLDARYGTALA